MRLIDADALKRKVQRIATEAWVMKLNASVETTLNQFIDYIDDAPTIEPKHGEWIVSYIDGIKQTECSACGTSFITYDVYGWNYCPWCGAKMKGADDE